MSKRTKLKLRNMKLFVSKYILNGRYVVRNILAITIAITFVALTIGTVKLVQMNVGNGEEVVETAVEENVLVVTADAQLDTKSIDLLRGVLDNSHTAVVQADSKQVVANAQNFADKCVSTSDDVSIVKSASEKSEIVGTLPDGAVGDIVSTSGEWYRIKSGDVEGFVKTSSVLSGEKAAKYAGPAVIEVFGEKPFAPTAKKEACSLSAEQQKLFAEYTGEAAAIVNQYIIGEERSFTIIAFPVPDIGEHFAEIFDETVKLNTLDYTTYERIQATIIDTLNKAQYVEIKGMNGNRTDLRVALYPLADREKETIFENCVADVNIPVGEVFTTPVLEGTNGRLHVKRVFLNELEYHDLEMEFKDGMVSDYTCTNFDKDEENKAYIKENVLFNHDTLPMGEFAIGTNTTAYMTAKKYDIESLFPILIAEKTGPHFAVGDTCYSRSEDVRVYNEDGKEIVAKDNSVSLLRKTDPSKAYFACHTDITIPYDELGSIIAYDENKTAYTIIEKGRFVLEGTEELNVPFA